MNGIQHRFMQMATNFIDLHILWVLVWHGHAGQASKVTYEYRNISYIILVKIILFCIITLNTTRSLFYIYVHIPEEYDLQFSVSASWSEP